MDRQVVIRVVRGQQVLSEHTLEMGASQGVRLQSLPGVRYQLLELSTGLAPQRVLIRRRGNTLVLDFMDDQGRSDSAELEGYFNGEPVAQGIVALSGDGQWVAYEAHPVHGLADVADLMPGQSSLWSLSETTVNMGAGAVGLPIVGALGPLGPLGAVTGVAVGAASAASTDPEDGATGPDWSTLRAAADANDVALAPQDYAV